MDEELIARTVREVLQEIGRMEASAENSVSMDAKKAVNGYIHGCIHGMSLRLPKRWRQRWRKRQKSWECG